MEGAYDQFVSPCLVVPPSPFRRRLHQAEGGGLNKGIAITRFPALVGRSADCDDPIPQPFISRRHCSTFGIQIAGGKRAATFVMRAALLAS